MSDVRNHEKSRALTQRFDQLYASPHSNFKENLTASEGKLFIERAEGARVWDVDGNEYVDYVAALGPLILGHRHPEIVSALKAFLDRQGTVLGSGFMYTEEDLEVGEIISEHVPCAERIKLALSGTEGIQLAIRLARAHTKRPRFVRFASHYHGWMDNVVAGALDRRPEGRPFPLDQRKGEEFYSAEGMGPDAREQSFLLPWNDFDALEQAFEQYADEIALILFEAFGAQNLCRAPKPGFLERIRELCDAHGVVMCFDEVVSGFRLGLGGAQALYGVTPDLCVMGKAVSGGLPFGVVAGKAEIMALLGDRRVLGPGTFNGYPLGVTAARATLNVLRRNGGEAYEGLARTQARLSDGLQALARKHGHDLAILQGLGAMTLAFGVPEGTVYYTREDLAGFDGAKFTGFFVGMYEEGILLMPDKLYVSMAHTDTDIDRTLEAADRVMKRLA